MSRYTHSSGAWEHMPQQRKPYLTGGDIGCALLAVLVLFLAGAAYKTYPYAACLQAGGTTEECSNVR